MIKEPLRIWDADNEDYLTLANYAANDDKTYTVTFVGGVRAVFSDEEFFELGLYEKEVKLKLTYEELIHKINIKRGYRSAVLFLRGSLKPVRDVENKLTAEGFNQKEICGIVNILCEEDYVNDTKYCMRHIKKRLEGGKTSRRLLLCELNEKGIDSDTALRCMDELGADDLAIAYEIAEKKLRAGDSAEKIKRYLAGRGFSVSTIIRALEALQIRCEDDFV